MDKVDVKEVDNTTYVTTVASFLKGKLVEVYMGDEYEDLLQADFSKKIQMSVIGILEGAIGDCLVIDSYYFSSDHKALVKGNILYINSSVKDTKKVSFAIYSVKGQLIKSGDLVLNSKESISLADLAPGVYEIRFNNNQASSIYKFIKE